MSFCRTFVNIVPVPFVKSVVMADDKPTQCQILHHGECACWIGRLFNQSKKKQERYHLIQQEVHRSEQSVAAMKEFRNLKEFAVVFQPWPEQLTVNFRSLFRTILNLNSKFPLFYLFFYFCFQFETDERAFDYSLLAVDCFHMSQKGHG